MCPLCAELGKRSNGKSDRDRGHYDYAGFFCSHSIDQAICQVAENSRKKNSSGGSVGDSLEDDKEDLDGT